MQKPEMIPATGERRLRFVGDQIRFTIRCGDAPQNFRAFLRTNLGQAAATRAEIISSHAGKRPMSIAFWRDIPMQKIGSGEWQIDLPVTEPGYFRAKAYLVDAQGKQIWPDGEDTGISVHPDCYRTGNTIYGAFIRMFGESKKLRTTRDEKLESQLKKLDERGYTVIPPSGKLRDLQKELPHIFKTLGCKILHLLPVNPTPTTFARMGRFGSPYACQDLTAIDPALVEFDQRTTGVDQFCELTYAAHSHGGKVFLDVVINHTGWGSTLWENHPEWFLRDDKGKFVSPGAWGNIWADLVELNPSFTELWEHLAEAFLTWCRRGVDGFRCDAGYKVPLPVWQYIEARVRQEFPDTVFFLEGLGGSWEATEALLAEGGMQWAYSELFQNYSPRDVQWYLDYALRQSERVGVYIHYSETHDNDRLAKKGRVWSLLRNRLCGLTSACGGFGFTGGVEWLADEKIEVHQSRGMNWGAKENIIPELAQLNELLTNYPCFFDGVKLTRLSPDASPVYALQRISAEEKDSVLVLVNNDTEVEHIFSISEKTYKELGEPLIDLLDQPPLQPKRADGKISFALKPGAAYCLSALPTPAGLSGENYRRAKAQAAWAISAMSKVLSPEQIGKFDWRELAKQVDDSPQKFLSGTDVSPVRANFETHGRDARATHFPNVIIWTLLDRNRVTPVPPDHWLLMQDSVPFRATLKSSGKMPAQHRESIPVRDGHIICFAPNNISEGNRAELVIERYTSENKSIEAKIHFLQREATFKIPDPKTFSSEMVLLTNGIGGMARMCVDLGRVNSKYDCVLGANLHASLPTDRHAFAKRIRVWLNADGFITPLNLENLAHFSPGPPAVWHFAAKVGDQRTVEIKLTADMLDGKNTTVFRFEFCRRRREETLTSNSEKISQSLLTSSPTKEMNISLTVRVDIEDRNFHSETHRNPETENHFSTNCQPLQNQSGFAFTPAQDRALRVFSDSGFYHHESEWCENIPHPVEQSRGQVGSGDAYSPGWFELLLPKDKSVSLVVCADPIDPPLELVEEFVANRLVETKLVLNRAKFPDDDSFGRQLALAARQFVVRRGAGKTVIAGYPWFLDWGRDSLIAARGLLAAGLVSDVTELLMTFGRFVENGTMPNTIHGDDASNRDTSDAPLWFGVVCEETAALLKENLYALIVDQRGRTIADVLREIATGYIRGTPNGIKMDAASGLIWSPSHFTWMDTNHPAGTPREGYPIEIQVLWIRLLRQLEKLDGSAAVSKTSRSNSNTQRLVEDDTAALQGKWSEIANCAETSLQKYFWLEEHGWFSDLLIAKPNQSSAEAIVDDALRSNFILAISFGFVTGERAQRSVEAALRYLVVPGALRTLAPLPVKVPLEIRVHGNVINDPHFPYWPRYEGDEDTRRKAAYHNGTAWTWTFPIFCEALARAWNFSPESVAAAKSYLGSMEKLLREGCLGQIPEILDGDAPHQQRGCDGQAWGVTEALRVWKLLNSESSFPGII